MAKAKSRIWMRLDNAAMIFPAASTKSDTNVFRFACELTETVDAGILSDALKRTLDSFPMYKTVLKRGLFWYYLEESYIEPEVEPENLPPCSEIYMRDRKTLLFRVVYHKKRISLEVYHVLSDGAGALQFLKMLVYYYLLIKHGGELGKGAPHLDYGASWAQRTADSFRKYYSNIEGQREKKKKRVAYRLSGPKISEERNLVIEGVMPVDRVLELARKHNTTIGVLLTAILIKSIQKEMPAEAADRPVVIDVPVNLRNHFPSESARNFFSIISIGYDFSCGEAELGQIIEHVSQELKCELTPENLADRLNSLSAVEHNFFARIAPLYLKDVSLKTAYVLNQRESTAGLSNIGKITMPDELKPYIKLFSVFSKTTKIQICMCSYENNLVIGFTSPFISTDIQRNFFKTLTDFDIPVTVSSNRVDI